jgi:transcriptional regulator with XRE-family HTH domain
MRRIYPSRQDVGDGYIRKLSQPISVWDMLGVANQGFDLDLIVSVLANATAPGASFSQRSLDATAKVTRGTVGEIIRGKIRNPSTQVLSALAGALGGDLSMFGLAEERVDPPTEGELEAALLDLLPDMPRGGPDKRARFLAEGVARVLRLPPARTAIALASQRTSSEEAAPPPGPTR